MQISVTKPDFSDSFKSCIQIATGKGSYTEIVSLDKFIEVYVYASNRCVGKFAFAKDEDNCILIKKNVTEGEFYPFEFAIFRLAKYLKKKDIKFIVWN